jgi:SAM-dependent methyltransferase
MQSTAIHRRRANLLQFAFKARNVVRGLVQAYGSAKLKRYLWNLEFARGRWSCLERTAGDCVYPFLEKYARGGTILDLGCGSGSTANEIDRGAYRRYVGVDISDVAIEQARTRSEQNRRSDVTTYVQSDIAAYTPDARFDVILFRDSIYYVPRAKIEPMLKRYRAYLNERGVFVVRMLSEGARYQPILEAIKAGFSVVEEYCSEDPKAVVIVFR